ncbi:hypothetical protein [Wolbachia endosymbiont (group A) of Agelastica alni]|uniref:hypothetical protein n=1 Tax=Wolbachia endosymbiont (group A) of Agelastica alni TaxID=3066130 RepID=UPI003340D5FD
MTNRQGVIQVAYTGKTAAPPSPVIPVPPSPVILVSSTLSSQCPDYLDRKKRMVSSQVLL